MKCEWSTWLSPLLPKSKEQVRDQLSLCRELLQSKWKCLCFLPGHTPLWHTLQSGRSLGRGHTCRTRRQSPSTFHPGTAQSQCVSSFPQETHIPHSIPRGAEPFSDPEETKMADKGQCSPPDLTQLRQVPLCLSPPFPVPNALPVPSRRPLPDRFPHSAAKFAGPGHWGCPPGRRSSGPESKCPPVRREFRLSP